MAEMRASEAKASWSGGLKDGHGTFSVASGECEGQFSFGTRFQDAAGSNPEELIGAAHAGCYSMALSAELGEAGYSPRDIQTAATVHLSEADDGFAINAIDLNCEAEVPEIGEGEFQRIAEATKKGCPVSKALAGVEIRLKAALKG